jgi:hypothetical protein
MQEKGYAAHPATMLQVGSARAAADSPRRHLHDIERLSLLSHSDHAGAFAYFKKLTGEGRLARSVKVSLTGK